MIKATVGAMPGTDAWTIAVFPAKDVPVGTEVGPIAALASPNPLTDEQIMDTVRDLAADGGRWPSDWIAAVRRCSALASPAPVAPTQPEEQTNHEN